MSDLDQLKKRYRKAKRAYYNEETPLMTDAAFDKLEDQIRAQDPEWEHLHKTGATTSDKKTEVDLLEVMPSLNKLYPEDVPRFSARPRVMAVGTYIIMDKLDGTSLQVAYVNRKPKHLITRGDGVRGGDISFMLPWLVKHGLIPAQIPVSGTVVLRCEALMSKEVFATKWSRKAKGKAGFDNARNAVNGLFNRKDEHAALRDVDIVVLGVYGMKHEIGLNTARVWGLKTVRYVSRGVQIITDAHLSGLLEHARKVSVYECDGIVVSDASWVFHYESDEKPKILPIAFKVNDVNGAAVVKVLEVIWQKTRTGRWQPKIRIEPTEMDGATVEFCTANNPRWMIEHGVGPGAMVRVLRSGGVIPKIVEVVVKAEFEPPPGAYTVNGAYFMIVAEDDATVRVRSIHHMLVTLGIENIALKTIIKLHDSGLMKTKGAYLKWPTEDRKLRLGRLQSKADFGPKQAQIIDDEICQGMAREIPLRTLMVASGCFDGLGDRKLAMIEKHGIALSTFLDCGDKHMMKAMAEVDGFQEKTITKLIEGYTEFRLWYAKAKPYVKVDERLPEAKTKVKGKLTGLKISFTGYRSPEQESMVAKFGAEVINFGAKTDVLLYKADGKASSKVVKAGDKAMIWDQFTKKYGL